MATRRRRRCRPLNYNGAMGIRNDAREERKAGWKGREEGGEGENDDGGFRCCTFISWLMHTTERRSRAAKDPLARPRKRRTDSDGIVSGIIVGQNIRTFFISKAKEREGERERMEDGGKGSGEGREERDAEERGGTGEIGEAAKQRSRQNTKWRFFDTSTDGRGAGRQKRR